MVWGGKNGNNFGKHDEKGRVLMLFIPITDSVLYTICHSLIFEKAFVRALTQLKSIILKVKLI